MLDRGQSLRFVEKVGGKDFFSPIKGPLFV